VTLTFFNQVISNKKGGPKAALEYFMPPIASLGMYQAEEQL
jgi:hypothetical protein